VKKEYEEEIEVLMAMMMGDKNLETESGESSRPSALDTPVNQYSSSHASVDDSTPAPTYHDNPTGEWYSPTPQTSDEDEYLSSETEKGF
jgi:hypothetical protein